MTVTSDGGIMEQLSITASLILPERIAYIYHGIYTCFAIDNLVQLTIWNNDIP